MRICPKCNEAKQDEEFVAPQAKRLKKYCNVCSPPLDLKEYKKQNFETKQQEIFPKINRMNEYIQEKFSCPVCKTKENLAFWKRDGSECLVEQHIRDWNLTWFQIVNMMKQTTCVCRSCKPKVQMRGEGPKWNKYRPARHTAAFKSDVIGKSPLKTITPAPAVVDNSEEAVLAKVVQDLKKEAQTAYTTYQVLLKRGHPSAGRYKTAYRKLKSNLSKLGVSDPVAEVAD